MTFHVVVHLLEVVAIVLLVKYVDDLSAITLKFGEQLKDATGKLESISVVSDTLKQVAATINQRFGGRSRAVKTEQEEDTDSKV